MSQIVYDPLAGLTLEADGSYTDDRTGYTLETCERCDELHMPADDSYGLCAGCLADGHRPALSWHDEATTFTPEQLDQLSQPHTQ